MTEHPAPIAPAPPPGLTNPVLIEGVHTAGRELRITLPDGSVWLYDLPVEDPAAGTARTVLVNLHLSAPTHASVFRPTAEGIHPFLGVATRIGIERKGGAA